MGERKRIHSKSLRENIREHKALFAVYVLLRASVILILIAQIVNNDWERAFYCILALVLMFPYLIFEIWRFIQPALFASERKSVGAAFGFGTGMFFLGCAVGYFLVFPFTFRFLTEYQLSPMIVNQISLNSYMGNFLMMIFVMGLVFELPLLSWLLSKLGLVNRAFFRKYRKHAVVVLLFLAAVITPSGDPFTLLIVFLPLYLLYELGIRFSRD